MEQPIFEVKLFGEFSAACNGDPVALEGESGRHARLILVYLLMKRGCTVSRDELAENLFGAEGNPSGQLENGLETLRGIFAAALPDREVIAQNGSYAIAEGLPCRVDVDTFEADVKEALREDGNNEKRLGFCLAALSAYTGDFLTEFAGLAWVMPFVLRYQEMCYYCVKTAYRIYREKRDLLPMIGILEKMIGFYPLEEEFRILYISSLYALDRIKEAVDEYDFFTTLLYDELGIGPSEELLDLYKKITGTLNSFASSIAFIRTDMNEESRGRGAYYCNYQSFTNTYRFVVRHIERSGQPAYLMLLTFSDPGSNTVKLNKKMQKISLAFHNVARESLRRGDAYARYSPSQFILLLMDISEDSCKLVSGRIQERFSDQFKDPDVTLHFKVIPAADSSQIADV